MTSRLSNAMARRALQSGNQVGKNGTYVLDPMSGKPAAIEPPKAQVDATQLVRLLAESGEVVRWMVQPDAVQRLAWLCLQIGPLTVPCALDAAGIDAVTGQLQAARELLYPAPHLGLPISDCGLNPIQNPQSPIENGEADCEDLLRAAIARTSGPTEVPAPPKTIDLLAIALDRAGVERVPFDPDQDLPGTVRSRGGCTVHFPADEDHLSIYALTCDFGGDFDATLADAVGKFRAAAAARGVQAADFRPLPHCPSIAAYIDYLPIEIDGIPARCMMSYSGINQSFLISLDAQLAP